VSAKKRGIKIVDTKPIRRTQARSPGFQRAQAQLRAGKKVRSGTARNLVMIQDREHRFGYERRTRSDLRGQNRKRSESKRSEQQNKQSALT